MGQYEAICENCSKPFETNDEEEVLCPECWKAMQDKNEGLGENEAD